MEFPCRLYMEKKLNNNEKNLLLQDLCGRLPYGVKCQIEEFGENFFTLKSINIDYENGHLLTFEEKINGLPVEVYLSEVKPCLRPLSSMTEEQRNEYHELLCNPKYGINIDYFDWCHKNNLDCRRFTPIGLAIDAKGKNIY